ncbi:uncharacterized protein N7473_004142 [Penicillium subrubescens]|uniref:DUF6594 domain-containing protein n=1 Tax=Penicillium subrubescens TaxID=1316194 RepID=A0A1Q5UII9_9EURO|nr:uncharacterized protein N7473_004142 [Penicillium subrubescens]KAJ5907226.1 hypothetical protein N7473_004142 [Penicillium subrubescens]OKP12296.1 hypothetical protein PENSUB_2032 [Penicillium subrubescens]
MFYRAQRESDLEGNHGGHATHDLLDFHDPSWIIDHHRPNLITKISKPGGSWFNVLFGQKHGTNNDSDNSQKGPGKGHTSKAVAEQSQLRLSSQLPQGVTGTIHKQLEETEKSYRINFAELQRLRLRQLQHKLMQHAIDLRYDAMEPPEWAEDLRQYVQALQDYDYMGKHTLQTQDPFIVTGERYIDRLMLHVAMRDKEDEADPLHWAKPIIKWESSVRHPRPISGTRDGNLRRDWIRGFRQRLGVAAVGGIFLIAPMWLVVLHGTLYTALVSTTVFVTIFGLLMAFFLDGLKDVLSSTAAYSAVLVVFVGLTVPTNTP